MPRAKKEAKPKARPKAKAKATTKPKAKPKAKSKTNSKRLPRGHKASTKTLGALEKDLHETADEVEEQLLSMYKEDESNDFKDLPTPREMMFCHAFLSNGFKKGPAIAEILPDLATSNRVQRADDFLARERVQKYLSRTLHARRLKMGVTVEWVCQKYLAWANLDITDFLDFVPSKKTGNGTVTRNAAVRLKSDIKDLPPLIRQSIKSLTVDDKGKVKVEFIDQKSALDSLAKLLGYANDKLDIESKTPIHLHFDKQDADA